MLMNKIEKGFPESKTELELEIQPYWRVKDMLSTYNGVIYMGDRVVVPEELRSRTLDTLHAAHQGTTSMRLRAERNLFWPNMARDISMIRQLQVNAASVDYKLSLSRGSYFYRGSRLYNQLPDGLIHSINQTVFKKGAKQWVLKNIPILPP